MIFSRTRKEFFLLIASIIILFSGIFLHCGNDSFQCVNSINTATLDPNGSNCANRCDCNDQYYEGFCVEGRCVAYQRDACNQPGKSRTCKPKNPNAKCKEGLQICRDRGLNLDVYGDCKCPSQQEEKDLGEPTVLDGSSGDRDLPESKNLEKRSQELDCKDGEKRECYDGPQETQGKGSCKAGQQTCQGGKWGACQGAILPQKETCNGKDDDCDGKVDNVEELNKPCVDKNRKGICQTGKWACEKDKKICKQTTQPQKEICNGKDDDCDGKVDNIAELGKTCVDKNRKGPCQAGKWACEKDKKICKQTTQPQKEICNGKDDDCDGKVDNIAELGKTCVDKNRVGACQEGKWACVKGKKICQQSVKPQKEICNGKDDDCDGAIDNMAALCPRNEILIKAGTFKMGSPLNEMGRVGARELLHSVTLSHDFYISRYEITQKQFQDLMKYNPSFFKNCGDSCPVENLTWHEAAAFCNALSAQKHLEACFTCSGSKEQTKCTVPTRFQGKKYYTCKGYRLPTEAEWEYAYRAGTQTSLYNGNLTQPKGKDPLLNKIGWYSQNAQGKTQPIGQKLPNAWNLFDMAGNVWEWTFDYGLAKYDAGPAIDPISSKPLQGQVRYNRVKRGGAAYTFAFNCRAAYRTSNHQDARDHYQGVRPVRTK